MDFIKKGAKESSPSIAAVISDYFAACSSSGLQPITNFEEFDDRVIDGVQVSFFTRDVNSSSNSSNEAHADDIQVEEKSESKFEHFRHWALVFYFPNSGRFITHEAFNENDILVWSCKQMPPNKIKGSKLYENIATCRTSPKRLVEHAIGISINHLPYNAGFRNCQEWVRLFAESIGGEVHEYIQKHFGSFFEKATLAAVGVGAAQAVKYSLQKRGWINT